MQQDNLLADGQEIDDAKPVSLIASPQLLQVPLQMPGMWHTQLRTEFLHQVQVSGDPGPRPEVERVNELLNWAPSRRRPIVLDTPHCQDSIIIILLYFVQPPISTLMPALLQITKRPPYAEQESEEIGDEVIARLNPATEEIESLEVLFFSTRLLRSDLFELPVTADLRLAVQG